MTNGNNCPFRDFLIALADPANDDLRTRLDDDPDGIQEEFGLSTAQIAALASGNQKKIAKLLKQEGCGGTYEVTYWGLVR